MSVVDPVAIACGSDCLPRTAGEGSEALFV